MTHANSYILTINSGSSSIKFAIYQAELLKKTLYGKVDRIGSSGTILTFNNQTNNKQESISLKASDHKTAVNFLIDWLDGQPDFTTISAIGHRVVYGMKHLEPEIITKELLDELHRIELYDPDHLPGEIELIKGFFQRHPKLPQVACFDTAFHSTMPRMAKILPIPRRYEGKGVQRYGFHGLSYSYLMEELTRLDGRKDAGGRVILMHLGSGASMAAVLEGCSIDTTMAFTPASGLMMSTRSGDVDPGLISFLARSENMTALQFDKMVNHESGLLGVSETSSDMRDLLALKKKDIRADEAVALFCYQAKKQIGAYTAVLGGLDTLVFSGGIGENSPEVRSGICKGLEFLGIELEEKRNRTNAPIISTNKLKTVVRVIHTDEEWMIAKTVNKMINII